MSLPDHGHEPVLLSEVLTALAPRPGEVFVDCTTGRGGHAIAVAEKIQPGGLLICLDVDPENLKYAKERMGPLALNARFFHANFAEITDVLDAAGIEQVDGLLADLGVSTNQLMETSHGLSFSSDAPLDMRLDPRIKKSAADLIRELPERELADILFEYADERASFKIARKIVSARAVQPILTTGQLADLIRSVVPPRYGQIDPATRTFQALRMAVNEELESLEALLEAIPDIIKPGGRAALISFHSGEDRLAKQATKDWQAEGWCEVLSKKPVEASPAEQERNPRSRSAKLRGVKFVEAGDGEEKSEVES